ncbi:MAG: hypothetical protein ACPGXL_01655 [Chitinophagales bacterium]
MKKITLAFCLLTTLVLLLHACNPDEEMENPIEDNSFYPLVFEDMVSNEKEYDIDLDGTVDLKVYSYCGAYAYESYKGISIATLSTFKVKTQQQTMYLCRDTLLSYDFYEDVYNDYYERYECDSSAYFTDTLYYQTPAFFQEDELDLNLIESLPLDSGYISLYYYIHEYPHTGYGPYNLNGNIYDTYTQSVFKEQEEGFLILEGENGQLLKMKMKFISDQSIFVDYVDEL